MDRQEEWYAANIPLRGQVIADVGANVGRLSQFFWDASGGTSRVISIEPVMENVVAIRERIRAAAAARWTVEACAASSRSGTVSLQVAPHDGGGFNSVVSTVKGVRKVRCRPLAALVPDATVVKLDIEGHEYEVLEQALPLLAGQVHSWALELHQVPHRPLQPTLAAFMGNGYRLYAAGNDAAHPDGPWVSHEILPTLDWSSVPVAVRGDGMAIRMLHVLALKPPVSA
jgi:FkbM family methyltransferase